MIIQKPVERSGTAHATPETIWKTCFEPMKWEDWDPDVMQVIEPSGPCENGTKFTFVMLKDQAKFPTVLSDVVKNETLTFTSSAMGIKAGGTIKLTPDGADKTIVDYRFGFRGILGAVVRFFNNKEVIEGTEVGLANIIRLSEEAQQREAE